MRKFWQAIAKYIDANKHDLLTWDLKWARILGAPAPHTLSSYSYLLDKAKKPWGMFWRRVIDWFFFKVKGQVNHCEQDYKRITRP